MSARLYNRGEKQPGVRDSLEIMESRREIEGGSGTDWGWGWGEGLSQFRFACGHRSLHMKD
jgi:hypothetical protein